MKLKPAAALAVFTFFVLGVAFGLESKVTGRNAFLEGSPAEPEPSRPFRRALQLRQPGGARGVVETLTVPDGERWVFELARVSVVGRSTLRLLTQGSGEDVLEHRLASEAQPLRAFADAGTRVTVALEGPGASKADLTLFGYVVSVP